MKWLGHIGYMGEIRNAYKVLMRKHNEEDTMLVQVLGKWNGYYWPKTGQWWPLLTQ
jgi:hypothetical protein